MIGARTGGWIRRSALPAALGAALAGCGVAPEPAITGSVPTDDAAPASTGAPASLEMQSFELVFRRVAETCPDPDLYGVDWQAAHDELLPRATAATTPEDLRPVLADLLGRLGASHYRVVPLAGPPLPASASAGTASSTGATSAGPAQPVSAAPPGLPGATGLRLRRLDGRVVVSGVEGPAAAAGVLPGWVLTTVGIQSVDTLLAALDARFPNPHDRPGWLQATLDGLLGVPEGQSLTLGFEDGEGRSHPLALTVGPPAGPVSQVGYGVPVQVSVESRVVAGSIGYVAFNAFYAPLSERFADVMTGFLAKPITGLVLDLRGNEGGVVGMVRGLSGWLLERPASLGELVYRDARVDLAVSPRAPAQRYTGPIAVLVDELTASSAEIFAAGLQGLGRARVFGSPTAGDALPSVFERLPDGDSLQMAVADYRSPSGVRIEGRGVVPDTAAPLRRDLLLTGADPALAAALSWLEPSP